MTQAGISPAPNEQSQVTRSARILIVEDDFLLAEELETTLTRWGHRVVGLAATGEAALRAALSEAPDILISDVRLRDAISGVTVAEEVHRRVGAQVVFLTAYPQDALLAGRDWGARFLAKPYSETELRQVVEELVAAMPSA